LRAAARPAEPGVEGREREFVVVSDDAGKRRDAGAVAPVERVFVGRREPTADLLRERSERSRAHHHLFSHGILVVRRRGTATVGNTRIETRAEADATAWTRNGHHVDRGVGDAELGHLNVGSGRLLLTESE